ncbi:hypothetical protein D3Z38_09420 [Clostridiales bacterium]|nr:hypothetical protein [Clostridiales bacterium]
MVWTWIYQKNRNECCQLQAWAVVTGAGHDDGKAEIIFGKAASEIPGKGSGAELKNACVETS